MKGNIKNIEMIKKRLKTISKGKLSVTESLLVIFLITGSLGYCDDSVNGTEKKVGLVMENALIYQEEDITVDSGIGILNTGTRGIVENTDTGIIRVNGKDSTGIYAEGAVTNRGEIIVNEGLGIELATNSKGSSNQEIGKIVVSNGGMGVKLNPTKGRFDNYGLISVTGEKSIGIYAEALTRNLIGQITVTDGIGIKVGKNGTGMNMSTITANNSGAFAMYGVDGGQIINEITGIINGSADRAIEVSGKGSTATNKGIISNTGSYGMYATNEGTVINDVAGTISNTGVYGVGAEGTGSTAINKGSLTKQMQATKGGTVINEGTLTHSGLYGMTATDAGSTAVNKSLVALNKGMYASNGGIIKNDAISRISFTGTKGMISDGSGSFSYNLGTISNTGNYGMYASSKGSVLNDEKAIVSNTGQYGMMAEGTGSTATNKGTVFNGSSRGMYALNGGTVINEIGGLIKNTGQYGLLAERGGSVARNNGEIRNTGNEGFSLNYQSTGYNYGIVANKGQTGVYNGRSTFKNYGRVENTSDYGVFGEAGATSINEASGVIANIGKYGLYANNYGGASTAVNNGTICNTGDYGMYVNGSSTGINNGIINNGGPNKAGVANGGIITNNVSGKIYVTGDNEIGMTANGSNSRAINKGEIIMDGNNQKGMVATNGASITNDTAGKILLSSANNSTGLYASGVGSTIKNNGAIYLDNEVVEGATSTVSQGATLQGNRGIVVENGAVFVNNGLFSVRGDFDSSDMVDSGQFVLEGGTVEADSIRGDYYASGALAWGSGEVTRDDGKVYESTEYEDQYDTYQMFKTDDMYADIYSNSAMFNATLKEEDSNGYYGIAMNRKNFNDIIDNQEFAKYLENNYTEIGKTDSRTDLYEAYKLVTNTSDLNKAVRKTFGDTIYPALSEQNYKIAKLNNKKIKEEVFDKISDQGVGEYNYVGYAIYLDNEDRKSDNFSENDMKYSAVSLGVDKKINQVTRVGVLGTIGKSDISFDDGAKRKDDVYQLNIFNIYEKDAIKCIANAYAGKIQGDLKRKLAVTSVYEEMEGDIESRYYGLNLSMEKKYSFDKINLSPRVELNSMYMEEDRVKENGKYALDVKGVNGKSVEAGVGFALNKKYLLKDGYKITPELNGMYYRELANQYKDREVKLTSVSNDSVRIGGYEEGKDTGELSISTLLEKENFSGRIGLNYEIKDQEGNVTTYMSLGYIL